MMNFISKKSQLNIKILTKRINRQLVSNFFTLDEFKKLSNRKCYKIIKIISTIEQIELTKIQIKEIVLFLKSDFNQASADAKSIIYLWDFITDLMIEKMQINNQNFNFPKLQRINNYRFGKFDLLRL